MHGIIFDLDGTLADSLGDIAAAMNRVLRANGYPTHTSEVYKGIIGEGAAELVKRALPEHAQQQAALVLQQLRADYSDNLLVQTRPYDGVVEALRHLNTRGVPMAVLSNKPHAMTARMVESLFGEVPFAAVLGQREGVPRKPDPAAALEAAHAMGVPATRCHFVGDTKVDMQTAVAAGMHAVGVTWGFRERAELLDHGAQLLLERPADLVALAPPV